MGLRLRRRLTESGRTLTLRVPKDIERTLNWKAGDYVEIYTKDDAMVVQKAQEKEPKNR